MKVKTYSRTYEDPEADYYARSLAKNSLIDFVTYTNRKYRPEPVHDFISNELERVLEGETQKLMVFAPPQHGKSELVSVRFPAYWIGHKPDFPVIISSYGAMLAMNKTGQARRILSMPEWQNIFYDELMKEKEYKDDPRGYLNLLRSKIIGAGVGGPVTGLGGGLGIIDDPIKNFEEAMSSGKREKIWEWWRGTFRTRIWENGSIVIIMTRWHEDDLCGRILNEAGGEKWKVIRLPALAEEQHERDEINSKLHLPAGLPDPLRRRPGQALSPNRFSKKALLETKTDVGSLVWTAEYQGFPRSYEGNLIKRQWLQLCPGVPADAKRVRYWDKAASENEGDESVGVLLAYKAGITYIEDVVKGRWGTLDRRKIMLETAVLDAQKYGLIKSKKNGDGTSSYIIENPGPQIVIEYEPGSGGKDATVDEAKSLRGFRVKFDRPTKGLQIRVMISGFIAQAEIGNVRIVAASWTQDVIDQLIGFPNAPHDDIVAAIAGAFKFTAIRTKRVYRGAVTR